MQSWFKANWFIVVRVYLIVVVLCIVSPVEPPEMLRVRGYSGWE